LAAHYFSELMKNAVRDHVSSAQPMKNGFGGCVHF
jgi:hypothetical protein